MKHYLTEAADVMRDLNARESGLTDAEAAERLEKEGKNKLPEPQRTSIWKRIGAQIADPMIIILLAAAALSLVTSLYENESFADVFIILFVVVLNAVLGVVQESKAEDAIDALKEMTAPESKVIRDGKLLSIRSEDLARGDIIVLEAGDSVPADARIIECASMKVEEAALTGESVPVTKTEETLEIAEGDKDVALADRKNMVYMGSTVVYGRGKAVVCGTGLDTEMGKIADQLTQAQKELTPLQQRLNELSKLLTILVLIICVVIFVTGILEAGSVTMDVMIDTFMLAISLAVAAIPEGLVAVVTIVLSIGVTKMSERNAVIRKLTAVETLGCAQIICSDKTGTLTQNKMTVVDHFGPDENLLAKGMALCTDAELDDSGKAVGEPTECALVEYALSLGMPKNELSVKMPRRGEAPFDSGRKMMSTVHSRSEEGKSGFVQFTKGAPDALLQRCTKILTLEGPVDLTDELRKKVIDANSDMAGRALRVLALAYKEYDELPEDCAPEKIENDMIFCGMTGMIDPIRPEVKAAVDECRSAGIRPIMITGDQLDTAIAIARDLGILEDDSQAVRGAFLDDLSDEELESRIEEFSVYARVRPEHKVRIVKAWQKRGKVTAMTGDGVNDAPSIKTADIGVGMGITGTDVTKNVADMILADDNFATIVAAVEEGRKVYANIRKAIQFLLSSNISEVVAIFTATMMNFIILKPAHILWINLITDSLPALALGMEPGEEDAMKKKPRSSTDGIFANGVGVDIIYQGALVSVIVLASYFIGHFMEYGVWTITNSEDGTTMAFLTLSMCEIFQSFNMRAQRKSIFTLHKQNLWLWGSAGAALALTTLVIEVPVFVKMFGFTQISGQEYFTALGLAFLIIPLVEIVKFFQRKVTGRS
ncbi:MAG: cation-translocating P-type ATPase [Anaerovoracaceae bacterium]|jgi:Ca2+-transporting ATPase